MIKDQGTDPNDAEEGAEAKPLGDRTEPHLVANRIGDRHEKAEYDVAQDDESEVGLNPGQKASSMLGERKHPAQEQLVDERKSKRP